MRNGYAALLFAVSAWLLVPACSLVVDTQELRKGCATGLKACEVTPGDVRCVSATDPQYGCARESCVPCTLTQAVEVCGGDGQCAVGTCKPEFENCNRLANDGCEIDLDSSYDNCGHCGSSCNDALRTMPRALSAQCQAGRCVVDECQDGYADCDGAAINGCEKALPDQNCGRCDGCPEGTACDLKTGRCE